MGVEYIYFKILIKLILPWIVNKFFTFPIHKFYFYKQTDWHGGFSGLFRRICKGKAVYKLIIFRTIT